MAAGADPFSARNIFMVVTVNMMIVFEIFYKNLVDCPPGSWKGIEIIFPRQEDYCKKYFISVVWRARYGTI